MVGLAAAGVMARVTNTPHSIPLWFGAFVASGLPDLDLALAPFGLRGPRFHRNRSHSFLVLGGIAGAVWLGLQLLPWSVAPGTEWVWLAALFSHPLVDVITTGPTLGARGYGVALFWPVSGKRWFVKRPVVETADLDQCRSWRDLWVKIRPEVYRLGAPAVAALALALLM